MLKLIYKDILVNKKYFKSMLLFSMLFPILSVINDAPFDASYLSIIMGGFTFFIMAVESEEKLKSYRMINSLPISRKTTVYARYLGSFLMSTLLMLLLYSMFFFLSTVPGSPFKTFNVIKLLQGINTVLIMSSIVMCITHCLGYMAGRIANFVVLIPVTIIITVFKEDNFSLLGKLSLILKDNSINMILIKLFVSILIYLLSMTISAMVYDRRDL